MLVNELPPMLERLALLTKMEFLLASDPSLEVRAGDIAGAYYATKASGFLRLPREWPVGVGNFQPLEVVKSNCAMPGSKLGSGLFLTQLDQKLRSFPRRYGTIREGDDFLGCNYSDDLLGIGSASAWTLLKQEISQQYSIDFAPGYPQRWVGMDFTRCEDGLRVACSSSCTRYATPQYRLPTQDDFLAIKPLEKSQDTDAIADARTWVGRLNFVAALHPSLAFAATFLSSALHYVPVESSIMAQRIIRAAG